MNLKSCLFLSFFLLFIPVHLSANPQTQTAQSEPTNGTPIENTLFHYFNDEPEIALLKLEILLKENPRNSTISEYTARCNWSLIKRLMKMESTDRRKDLGSLSDLDEAAFQKLESRFIIHIQQSINRSKDDFEKTKSPENAYNLAMALSTKSAYLLQFHSKKKSVEAAELLDQAVVYINFCIKNPPPYCLAYSPLGAIQYFLNKEVTSAKKVGYLLFARFKVPNLYKTVNFDKDEAIEYLEIASRCAGPNFRKTEALFILAEFLMDFENNQKKREKNDLRAYPILEELHKTYPNNKKIEGYLELVQNHLKNKSR